MKYLVITYGYALAPALLSTSVKQRTRTFKEDTQMGKRQLLFVTYRDENIEEGGMYAIELAKAMYEDITLLLVQKKSNFMEKLGEMMTAVSFAEADEHDTARQIMAGD